MPQTEPAIGEVVALRTRSSKTTHLGDNHDAYDVNGTWQTIDPSLIHNLGAGTCQMLAADYRDLP